MRGSRSSELEDGLVRGGGDGPKREGGREKKHRRDVESSMNPKFPGELPGSPPLAVSGRSIEDARPRAGAARSPSTRASGVRARGGTTTRARARAGAGEMSRPRACGLAGVGGARRKNRLAGAGGYEPAPGVLFVRDARGEGRGDGLTSLEAGELRRARGRAELVGVRFHQRVARGRAGEPDGRARVLVRRHRVASGGGVLSPDGTRRARRVRGAARGVPERGRGRRREGARGRGPRAGTRVRRSERVGGVGTCARDVQCPAPRGTARTRKKTSRVRRVEKCRERKRPPKRVSRSHHVCANSHEFFGAGIGATTQETTV